MKAPERIWVDDDGYWFDIDPSETRPEYIRKDASDAAIAAARAEGVREGMLKAAAIAMARAEQLRGCNFKPGGFGPLGGWVGVASEIAERIRAAAEAQP